MSTVNGVPNHPTPCNAVRAAEPAMRELFKGAFRRHAAGVAIITAEGKQGPVALTATSVISVSADPPVLAFSLSADSASATHIKAAKSLVVHLLQAEQLDIARLCSTSGTDRFSDTSKWKRLPSGEPVLVDAPVWIRGTIIDQMNIHGSTLVAVRASEISATHENQSGDAASPLIYHDRAWHALSETSRLQT
ncbi:flavin reductase family protein [Paraburkholderia sp. USG1]|uniref:flavin reductase family protein n=1 Tax=Paraburkholderia sp. USG1 TaxID=2952268 RepID=UPI0028548AA2|nr:flavin reductase family protein [Paraburkholderia sp. USG1]MDR8398711.1 flavin reductase family protein [Paraburkholderia sp. USG1]